MSRSGDIRVPRGETPGERTRKATILSAFGPGMRMRVTATARLSASYDEALAQRREVQRAFGRLVEALAEAGVELEFVVGMPRSPNELQATLRQLVDPDAEAVA